MNKKLLAVLFAAVAAFSLPLAGCGKKGGSDDTTRMTVDINPSVEFMLDADNKVVSVTALNDDGSLLIAGEAFVGKTADEAARLTVSLAVQTGYLVKGEAEADGNGIRISISGDAEAADALFADVKETVDDFVQESGIAAAVERAEALGLEALRTLVGQCDPTLTDEELAAMSEQELINRLRLARIECAELLTESLREAYYAAKAYEIDLAGREATKAVIDGLGDVYAVLKDSYSQALAGYSELIRAVEQARYEYLISADSAYQKALQDLMDKKAELQQQKNVVAQMVDGAEKAAAELILAAKESAYETATSALELSGQTAEAAIETTLTAMRAAEEQLRRIEEALPDEIKTALTENAEAFDEAVNNAKDNAFAKFEETYGDDIKAAEERLKARKAALIAAVGA